MPILYNPFRPNGIVPANMFCGREREMLKIRQSLLQTKHGNPRNFLIEGERGIGKSSLLQYISTEASPNALGVSGKEFQFLTLSIELAEQMNYGAILNSIATEFKTQLLKYKDVTSYAKTAWEFLSNWKVMGVEYKRNQVALVDTELLDDLARTMAGFTESAANKLNAGRQLDGILLLIDEADKPHESARLGEFAKLFTERLAKVGCGQVCLGFSGLPTLTAKLRSSHESAPRVFEAFTVGVLPEEARKEVIRRALVEASEKNGKVTSIADDALQMISTLSEGYPHFVQQFGASAFDKDDDYIITLNDVTESAFGPDGALDQLGRRYFYDLYFEQISSPGYRKVLHTMTEHMDSWVSKTEILSKSGVKATQVTNALHALKDRGIILINPGKKAEYRLPSKSFAVWLKVLELRSVGIGVED